MNFNKISRAIQASHGKGLVLILALLMLVPDIFAQDYTVTLNQRRMGNQIGVEVWIKGASETVDTIANMSLAVTYNTTHLRPADPTSYSPGTTDSVDFNVEQTAPLPYRSITSAFDNTGDYAGLSVTPANNGVDSVSILNVNWGSSQYDGTGGSALLTEGKGSFIGIMRFDIIDFNNLGSDEYTEIAFNTATNIGNFVISDTEGEDVEFQADLTDNYTVVQQTNIPVKGIDILNPNGPDEAVNRNKNYESLPIAGYPIYFERSGLIDPTALETYGNTEKLGYRFDYVVNYNESLADENQNWVEFLRVVEDGRDEDDIVADGDTPANYYSGEIVSTTEGTDGYLITQGDGSQILPGSDYGGVLRVIWDDDAFFAERSEEARLRIAMLDTTGTTSDIDDRDRVDALTYGMSDANFILSRLFFIQLDGASSYLKTQDFDKFDNPSQMTVMAWVNVSSIPSATYSTEPGIVVSSVGPGFDEGAWMLYMKDGQYPAFRARDVKGGGADRGQDGSIYIGTVQSPEAFEAQDASVPIDNNANHTGNWRHVAAVVNLNSISLYIDGELVDAMTNSNANDIRMLDDEQSIWVGINPNETITSDDYLHAGVKEVQIWKEALTQGEIRQFATGVTNPTTLASGDVRTGLRYYFPLNGVSTDEADALPSNAIENDQEGADVIEYFETAPKSSSTVIAEERFPYRPDKSHIRVTSPSSFSGVKNLEDVTFPIRFTAFGLGDNENTSSDLTLEFSRDGGNTWAYAIDENGNLMDDIDIESGTDNWEPYQSATVVGRYNDLQALAPGADTNYSKTVRIRLRGNSSNNQSDIIYESGDFDVAPYFSLELDGENNVIEIKDGRAMNLLGGSALVEAWINPYRLPNDEEVYFPIVNKKDTTVDNNEGLHYALRVLNTGQVQLAVGQYDSNSDSNTELLATTSENATLIDDANISSAEDSTWYHIAAYMNLGNGSGNPTVRIYLDGNLLELDTANSTLMSAENVAVHTNNTYSGYIGFEDRGSSATYNQSFIGEMKRVRYWNGLPDDIAFSATEPSDLTRFIQGSANIDGAELLEEYQDNLIASFDLDGTSVLSNGKPYNSIFSKINGQDTISAQLIVNNGVSYKGVQPYIKLVEPVFEQEVKVDEQLYVRWAGFHYDAAGFETGNSTTNKESSLEYSAFGGGNSAQAPYEYTASDETDAAFSDAFSLPLTSEYKFPGTNAPNRQFAGILDMSIVKDNEDNTQGQIDAALLNAKLRLRGEATLNAPTAFDYQTFVDLRDESELFTITPKSNFTLRVLLEGMHRGGSQPMNISDTNGVAQAIGTGNFDEGAFRITLYSDQGGSPGVVMATAVNDSTYEQTDPNSPSIGTATSDFGNISFVFTDEIADSTYFVLVEHKNHLPVLSRYSAPFFFSGDDEGTWEIESGWDFMSWNGDEDSVLTEANAITTPPTMGNSYSAFGAVESNTILGGTNGFDWSRTGLNYNLGQSGTDTTGGLAAMVAGDIIRDGQINAADAVQARLEAQTSFPDADVTQDGIVNGLDRNIVDRNFGKVWSLESVLDYNEIYNGTSSIRHDDNNPGNFNTLNENDLLASAVYNSVYNSTVENNLDNMKTVEELLLANAKANRKQAGGISYNVYKEVEIDEATNIVQVKLYIENKGGDWAMGNSSFAIKYDNDVLQFNRMIDVQNSIWNDVPGLGYFSIYNAPSAQTPNPVSDVTSIEIDYDNRPYFDVEQNRQLKKEGSLVPSTKTLVGTLVFSMRDANAANDFTFEWDKSTVILDIFGRNLTGDGDFDGTDDNSTEVVAELQAPNGGETWLRGNSYFVHWSTPSFAQNLWIELSADRGDTWMRINQLPVDAADASFKYFIEEIETTEALVRLVDAATGMEIDRSDEVFTITQPKNRITKPAATDQIYVGGQMGVIEWATDISTNVRFDFSPDGVNNWRTVVPSVDSELGSIEWIIPSEVNSDRAQIVMYDVASGAFLASSDQFRVLAGDLDFTSPDQNTVLAFDVEPIASVEWINNGVTVFDLEFSKDGGKSWETVQTSVNALREQYDWILPSVKTDEAVLRALHQGVEALEYDRTGVFKLDNATNVENGVNFTVGEAFPNPFRESTKIEFSLTNPVTVSAELYNAAGLKVATINNGLMSSGSHFLSIDANQLNNSGVYFVKMMIGEEVFVKELVLTK